MSSSRLSRSSISKQRGALMSSRLMPPKVGAIALTVATISSGSLVLRQIGKASTPPNSLNSIALPSITGMAASGPMSPSPRTALPSDTTAPAPPPDGLDDLLGVLGPGRVDRHVAQRVHVVDGDQVDRPDRPARLA